MAKRTKVVQSAKKTSRKRRSAPAKVATSLSSPPAEPAVRPPEHSRLTARESDALGTLQEVERYGMEHGLRDDPLWLNVTAAINRLKRTGR